MTDATPIGPAEVIELLGGNAKTAELCDVTPGAVSQWLGPRGIPKTQFRFLKLARPDIFRKRNVSRTPQPTTAPAELAAGEKA
jgi:hypothetical protein